MQQTSQKLVTPEVIFTPREYQLPIIEAVIDGYKRVLAILPRRAGKDLTAWNILIRESMRRVGVYWYIFPTYSQGRKILFDGIDSQGHHYLDYIPKACIAGINNHEMKIKLINGSIIQVVGSDNYNNLVGTNAIFMLFSEYALQDPTAYSYLRPILLGNAGVAIFLSTPRGRNHLYDLYEIAKNSPDWFVYRLTVDDTQHISTSAIRAEIASGEMSEDMAMQEYWVSWDLGVEGAYYTKYMDKIKLANQITNVPWDPALKVHSFWDLGFRDSTTIIMAQLHGNTVRIIDTYSNSDVGLEHYAKQLQKLDYNWGKHFAPHDIAVRELGTGMSRLERARQLGISFVVAPNLSLQDGIESVRATLPRVWFDQTKAAPLIKALENYRKEYDSKRKVYKDHPLHDSNSHFADAMRYLCLSLPKAADGLSPDALDARYRKAMGYDGKEPGFFDGQFNQPYQGF